MAFKKNENEGKNYLFLVIGGIFGIALLVLLAYSFSPLDGCVGVVEIRGAIVVDDVEGTLFSDGVVGSESIAKDIESADLRTDVKSVLLIIDSPGGSVVASKQIYDSLRKLNKPSASYLQEMAASGGYMVASGTDVIIANPDVLTGNIGARMTLLEFSGLFSKLGINETSVKSGAMKDMGSPARPLSADELAVLQSIVDEAFAEFRGAVETGREGKLDSSEFSKILDARLLTGRQAKKIGLVDELGDKRAAIKKAAELGGISSENPKTCKLSGTKGSQGILGSISSDIMGLIAKGGPIPRLLYN